MMTARSSNALIEVNITFHPEALREALSLRSGAAGRLLRMVSLCLFAYLAIGMQMVMPRFYPELRCNPAPLLVAYCALRSRGALLPSALALAAGLAMDAGAGCRPGAIAIPMVAIAGLLHMVANFFRGWRLLDRWGEAAVGGAIANGVFSLWTICLLADGMPWRHRLYLCAVDTLPGMLLAAVAYAPVAFFVADCLLQPAAKRSHKAKEPFAKGL